MIADKIKNARTIKKLTQEQVAEDLNVSRQTISNWENGKSLPDIVSIIRMSELYDLSLDELLKDLFCCIKVKIYKNVHINSLNPTIAEKTRK